MMTLQIRQLQRLFEFCNKKHISMVYIKYEHVTNHTVVVSKCEVNREETTETLIIVKNNLHQSQKNDALLCLWLSTSTKNKHYFTLSK